MPTHSTLGSRPGVQSSAVHYLQPSLFTNVRSECTFLHLNVRVKVSARVWIRARVRARVRVRIRVRVLLHLSYFVSLQQWAACILRVLPFGNSVPSIREVFRALFICWHDVRAYLRAGGGGGRESEYVRKARQTNRHKAHTHTEREQVEQRRWQFFLSFVLRSKKELR